MNNCEDDIAITVQPCRSPLSPPGGLHMPTQYPIERQMKEINNATEQLKSCVSVSEQTGLGEPWPKPVCICVIAWVILHFSSFRFNAFILYKF